ncbi:uncharacterized protein LOC128393272 [Panonychus citri]|uniref:uncharacterized protein LOC128393272 n=1 Tax=Panonychus citri TaxID=50023 RepID=UPI002307F3F8|nr:uncharacterized protein LOC128393272 [Panonychus citri]
MFLAEQEEADNEASARHLASVKRASEKFQAEKRAQRNKRRTMRKNGEIPVLTANPIPRPTPGSNDWYDAPNIIHKSPSNPLINETIISNPNQSTQSETSRCRKDTFNHIAYFMIATSFLRTVFNNYGTPILDRLKIKQAMFQSTQIKHRAFAKITISTSSENNLKVAINLLRNCLPPETTWRMLDKNHCSICFRPDHNMINCSSCSACFKLGHKIANCPWLKPNEVQTPTVNTVNSFNYKKHKRQQKTKPMRDQFNRTFWQSPGLIPPEDILNKMQPIGLPPKPTLALDTEGVSAENLALSVCLSGWFETRTLGVQTVYFDYIKTENIKNLSTPITGINSTEVLYKSQPIEIIKTNLLSLCRNKRLLVFDQQNSDLRRLTITENDLIQNSIELVNVQELFGNVSLQLLVDFFFPGTTGLKRHDPDKPISGHSPETDSRYTLKLYRKFVTLKEEKKEFPIGDELRNLVCRGKTWIQVSNRDCS